MPSVYLKKYLFTTRVLSGVKHHIINLRITLYTCFHKSVVLSIVMYLLFFKVAFFFVKKFFGISILTLDYIKWE